MSQQPPRTPPRQWDRGGGDAPRAHPGSCGWGGRWDVGGGRRRIPPALGTGHPAPCHRRGLRGGTPRGGPLAPVSRGGRAGAVPAAAGSRYGGVGTQPLGTQPDVGLPLIILIAADIFGSGAADGFFFFFSLCSSAGLRRQRAVTCPGTGAAGWARRRLDALGGGRRERGDTFPRRRFNNRSFKARFIRARQKARQISGPRNSTDGAIFP